MADRMHEDQEFVKKLNGDLMMAVAQDDPVQEVQDGRLTALRASRRGELYVSFDNEVSVTATSDAEGTKGDTAPDTAMQIGGEVTTNQPAYANGSIDALSLATDGDLRVEVTDSTAVDDAAAPAESLSVGGTASATVPTPDEGDMSTLSTDLFGGARVRVDRAQAAHDAESPAEVVLQGQYAETTVPAAVADMDTVRPWYDEYGRQIVKTTDLATNSMKVTDVAPAKTQKLGPLTFTQLDEPGATAATNCRNYSNFCFQVTIGGTPLATTVIAEGSHDNSNWFQLSIDTTTMRTGWTIANNQATCDETGTFELRGSGLATEYIRCAIMDTSGSPDAATADIQLMLGN